MVAEAGSVVGACRESLIHCLVLVCEVLLQLDLVILEGIELSGD